MRNVAHPRRLSGMAQSGETRRQEESDEAISHDHRSEHVGTRHPGSEELPTGEATDECPQRRREGADEVVPGKDGGTPLIGDRLRECRLLDREEWSDFLVGGAEHADRGNNYQQDEVY